jgi:hypothetical protein
MLASQIVKELTDLIEKHGDLRVADEQDLSPYGFEYNDDDGECFVFGLNNSDNE